MLCVVLLSVVVVLCCLFLNIFSLLHISDLFFV